MPRAYRQPTGHLYTCFATIWLKNHPRTIHRGTHPHDRHKLVAEMNLAEIQNKGMMFENRTGATVNDILTDDKANKAFVIWKNIIYRISGTVFKNQSFVMFFG